MSSFLLVKSHTVEIPISKVHEQNLKFYNLNVIFQSPCKLDTLFKFKGSLDIKIRSDLIYCYTCSNCNVTYYGKTY